MKKTAPSLEGYLKKALATVPYVSGAKSYSDYIKDTGSSYKSDYSRAMQKAALNYTKRLAGYGATAEGLANAGISGGYAARLDDMAKESYIGEAEALYENKAAAESELLSGYRKYLESFTKQRDTLKKNVREQLMKGEVISPDSLYSYGIGAGLTEAEAKEISDSVYKSLRLKVMGDILSRVASLTLDPERAVMLATDKGLNRSDVDLLRKRALEYYSPSTTDSSYLDYLESIGNKNTSTFN